MVLATCERQYADSPSKLPDIAVVCTAGLGWKSVRMVWRRCFNEATFYNPEDYGVPERRAGFKTFGRLMATRRAAQQAIREGHSLLLVTSVGEAALLPRPKGVRYVLYGDSTPRQVRKLYLGKPMSWKGRLQERALIRLASYGHTFLAMTEWYRRGLVEELGVRSHQTRVWRQPIDTERFYPPSARPDEPFRIVFIGGDFKRKGGDLLLEVATSSEFAKIQFDFVTEYLGNDTGNVRFHNGIKPQSEELLSLLGKSHLFVLPTRADCSSNAALEAMSTGLPAVLGDVGGSSELLVEGESGALMRTWNRDAIAEMIRPYVQDRNMLLSHGVAARARVVERHSITVHTSELARILSDRA